MIKAVFLDVGGFSWPDHVDINLINRTAGKWINWASLALGFFLLLLWIVHYSSGLLRI